jgi:DNA repair photolyase
MLNKQKGNMYGFVTHTWNPIKGKCLHKCSYCYMDKMYKRYKWNETIRLDDKCLNDQLGKDNFIFVGSSTDMWSEDIPDHYIKEVLHHCYKFDNQYLFQSKNPKRFVKYSNDFPLNSLLGTTLETNYSGLIKDNAPDIMKRINAMIDLNHDKKMITIEPVLDFEPDRFFEIIKRINPIQVNIGADSGNNKLPEPSKEKLRYLISRIDNTDIKLILKDNLKRLL